jgi:hypothetical protein
LATKGLRLINEEIKYKLKWKERKQ